jgi:hypothetical protein
MDKRIEWKYGQLPAGEQAGKRPEAVDGEREILDNERLGPLK